MVRISSWFNSELGHHIETTALIRCIKAFFLFTFNQCYVIIKALVNVRKVRYNKKSKINIWRNINERHKRRKVYS